MTRASKDGMRFYHIGQMEKEKWNFINCEKSSKCSIIEHEDIGKQRIIKKINGVIKPRTNI